MSSIDDSVELVEERNGVPFFRKTMKLAKRMDRILIETAFEVLVRPARWKRRARA